MANAAGTAIALVLVATLIFAAAAIADTGFQTAGEPRSITNETFTPSTGSFVALDFSNNQNLTYSHTVTVYDENETEMIGGEDYTWHDGNGTVKALAGGDLAGDANATISYSVYDPSDEQTDRLGAITTFIEVSQFWPLVIIVALVIIIVSLFGGL